jgi:hypothetical protein
VTAKSNEKAQVLLHDTEGDGFNAIYPLAILAQAGMITTRDALSDRLEETSSDQTGIFSIIFKREISCMRIHQIKHCGFQNIKILPCLMF